MWPHAGIDEQQAVVRALTEDLLPDAVLHHDVSVAGESERASHLLHTHLHHFVTLVVTRIGDVDVYRLLLHKPVRLPDSPVPC
jgi:hypothetical protein